MLAAAVAFCAMLAPDKTLDAAAFFPLHTGDRWTYQEVADGKLVGIFVDECKGEAMIAGKPALQVEISTQGRTLESAYYRVLDDSVYLVASDPKHPLLDPYAILKVGGKTIKWKYAGTARFLTENDPMTLQGVAKRIGKREMLGRKVEALEVTLDAVVGNPKGTNVRSKQVSVYGEGIGLFELKDTTRVNKTTHVRVRTLTQFEPAKR